MSAYTRVSRIGWLAAGIVIGLAASILWPREAIHAVSTDRQDGLSICTGPVDENFEAVYILDSLTGDLKASVLSPVSYKFNSVFATNVMLKMGIDGTKNPKFVMVTGVARLRRGSGGNVQPADSILYVAEMTSGKIGAFMIPWTKGAQQNNTPQSGELVMIDMREYRTIAVRETN